MMANLLRLCKAGLLYRSKWLAPYRLLVKIPRNSCLTI